MMKRFAKFWNKFEKLHILVGSYVQMEDRIRQKLSSIEK